MAITYTQNDLVQQVYARVDDQPDPNNVVDWLNAGMNIMAMKVNAILPMLSITDGNSMFVFDDKWAEIPVLYACARFKQADLMYTDADRYTQQFQELLREFTIKYNVPMIYKDDPNIQRFTATAAQTQFNITNNQYVPTGMNLSVYVGDTLLVQDQDFQIGYTYTDPVTQDQTVYNNGVQLIGNYDVGGSKQLQGGEIVTMLWTIDAELEAPPYAWFTNW